MKLDKLQPGQTAVVSAAARERRLRDLGIIEGTQIGCLYRSPLGDPTAYYVRGATVALRRDQAELIEIKPI